MLLFKMAKFMSTNLEMAVRKYWRKMDGYTIIGNSNIFFDLRVYSTYGRYVVAALKLGFLNFCALNSRVFCNFRVNTTRRPYYRRMGRENGVLRPSFLHLQLKFKIYKVFKKVFKVTSRIAYYYALHIIM